MESEQSYLSSLLAKLYENTAKGFEFTPDLSECAIKQEGDIKKEGESEEDEFIRKPESKKRKVVDDEEEFFKNSSAAIIAESTEKTLLQMNIDPNSKEGKMQRRKIRNRMSAQIHRERKKAYIDYLEEKVRKRDEVISLLQAILKKSQSESERLRVSLEELRDYTRNHSKDSCGPNAVPIISPASSSTSNETTSCQHTDASATSSQSSLSPDLEQDYFSDFEMEGDIDPTIFRSDSASWFPEQYQDLPLDIVDFDESMNVDDVFKPPIVQGTPSNVGRSGGSLSMFSIVLMMGFSFFSGIFSMGSMTGTQYFSNLDAHVSSRSQMQPSPFNPSFVSSFGTPGGLSYPLLSTLDHKNINGESGTDVTRNVDDLIAPAATGGGRVLLSLTSSSDSVNEQGPHHPPSSPLHTSTLSHHLSGRQINRQNLSYPSPLSRSPAKLAALWRQQNYNFIGTIFPRKDDKHEDVRNSTRIGKNKKYLRFQPGKDKEVSDEVPETRPSSKTSSVDKSVTVYQQKVGKIGIGDRPSNGDAAVYSNSKILLSEGRVLLSPLLADLRMMGGEESSQAGSRTPDYDTDRAIIPSVPGVLSDPASRQSSMPPSGDTDNLLTMLIPASSIQWGFEWADETSPDNSDVVMKHLLKNFNISSASSSAEYTDESENSSVDLSKLWLEIGCNVLQAKIVQSIL